MQLLGLSGSLRRESSNSALLLACAHSCAETCSFELFDGLRDIPPFDPERAFVTEAEAPAAVQRLREAVSRAEAVLISSPEYARGIPGTFKNALDWLVPSGEFSGKPVALLNASANSEYIIPALETVLGAMDARLIHSAFVQLPPLPRPITGDSLLANAGVRHRLAASLEHLQSAS